MRDPPMSVDPTPMIPPVARLAPTEHDALPAGTRFGEFEILHVLGVGGFGIVYLAQDHSLERQVALKEYMPAMLAARGSGAMITIRARSFAETYANGLRSFVNEARLLARFDHASLVKVYRVWEDNGTAYMVMPYLAGRTLRDARRAMAAAPDEAWLRGMLAPVLDALEQLHREGVFHRDIAPDNILLPLEGPPILLDFGAARRVIGDHTQSLTAVLKPSYAPIEQYAEMAAMRQGPWTDIYALGAVLHYLLFGAPPAPATARALQPDAEPIEQRRVAGVSPRFIAAVGWMLGVRPSARPQSVAALRAALAGEQPIPAPLRDEPTPPFDPARAAIDAAARPHAGRSPIDRAQQTTAPAIATAHWPTEPATHPPPAAAAPAATPMRSTPPGTLPPVSMPAPHEMPLPAEPSPAAVVPASRPGSTPARRAPMLAALVGAVALAAIVLWQFVGVVNGTRSGAPTRAAVSAAPVALVRAAPADPSPPRVASPPAESTATEAEFDAAAAASGERPSGVRTAAPSPPSRTRPVVVAGPSSARAACSAHSFLAFAICVDRECEQRRFRNSPDCARILEDKRRRAQR